MYSQITMIGFFDIQDCMSMTRCAQCFPRFLGIQT